MEIKIIGENSSNRIKLLKNVHKATKNIKGSIEVSLIENNSGNKYGIGNTPILVINEKVISQGKVLTDREITNYIKVLS